MDLPCCFEGCPELADHGPALEVAWFRDTTFHGPVAEAAHVRPCSAHRQAVNETSALARHDVPAEPTVLRRHVA